MDIKKVQKVTFVFTVWTLLYLIWFRWFMMYHWEFNIFMADHWKDAFNEWWNKGWIIQGSWWVFVIMLFLFIPLWILGFSLLISIDYKAKYNRLFETLIYQKRSKNNQKKTSKIRVKRKKSYIEVRPQALAGTPQEVAPIRPSNESDVMASSPDTNDLFMSDNNSATSQNTSYSHREVTDDFEGKSPFETPNMMHEFLDKEHREELKENLPDIMEEAGAVVIEKPVLDGNSVDYLALSTETAFLVLTDKEEGDWLADEERFNDEDPLWFSETSHRISPITILKNFEAALKGKLSEAGLDIQTQIILVKTNGNIINAEDMLPTWEQMKALIARSSFGLPEELPSFTDVFPKGLSTPDDKIVKKVKSFFEK
ncbi:MAG: hypothetical protein J6Y03_06265 [Alphaproteobacteria bacterium]|nr:hypothetical protein [Alphaproteobacteria bacterium]